MATAAMDSKEEANRGQEPAPQPPSYFVTSGPASVAYAGLGSNPGCYHNEGFSSQTTLLSPTRAPTIMVTQPVVVGSGKPPDTTCALIMSTLSAIFCGFMCGAAGILVAWKARLQVLDKQYEHAQHSLRIVWVFFSLAVLFGLALWIPLGIYLYLITNPYTYW